MPEGAASIDGGAGRVLALDLGTKRTGMALSDAARTVARPAGVLANAATSEGMASISRMVESEDVTCVVVGVPGDESRRDDRQAARCRSFAGRLRSRLAVPVELHDERFTSLLADRTRAEVGTGAERDSVAAAHILESWLAAQGGTHA